MTPVLTAVDAPAGARFVEATANPASEVLAATLERVAIGLRGARARTGMSEERAVALLIERGVAISVPMLRRAERTGELDFALASCLADVYGSTTDCLAGRRPDRRQQNSLGVLAR
jgi:hypothetical protein